MALRQGHGFTCGILANQIGSFAGQQERTEVPAAFLQPFIVHTAKTRTLCIVNTKANHDSQAEQATMPMNFQIRQLVKIGKQPIAFEFGYRYYVNTPVGGPDLGPVLQHHVPVPEMI